MSPTETKTRAERRAFLNAFKAMVGCIDCRTTDGRLDFDHRDPTTKLFKIGANVCQGWRRLYAEIEKCDVRCAPCHTRRHKTKGTHCRRGHELIGDNLGMKHPKGKPSHRFCRECIRIREREKRAERRRAAETSCVGEVHEDQGTRRLSADSSRPVSLRRLGRSA